MTERIAKTKALAVVDPNSPAIPEGWADKFKQYVDETHTAAVGDGSWPYLSSQNGIFSYMESPIGKEVRVIVLGAVRENLKYAGPFVAGQSNPPECWAIDTAGTGELVPSSLVENPHHPTCEGCEFDKWGSGAGKGKACRNYVRLVMVSENDITKGSLVKLPPTAIAPWAKYVSKIQEGLGRPLFSVVTKLSIVPRGGSFTIQPDIGGFINDPDALEQLHSLLGKAEEHLFKEYEPREEE